MMADKQQGKLAKFYKIVTPDSGRVSVTDSQDVVGNYGLYGNYSWMNKLIQGSSMRLQRYREYDMMDEDTDVSRALDVIAQEICGNNPKSDLPMDIVITAGNEQQVPSRTVVTLRAALRTWCNIQRWNRRLYTTVRNTIKYGDTFFFRNDEQNRPFKFVHPKNAIGAIVSRNDVTDVKGWQIRTDYDTAVQNVNFALTGGSAGTYNVQDYPVDKVVRFGLHDDMSDEAPFSLSILRSAYKIFKQKQMLEDSILIYRIQRAPEKRVFKLELGNTPPHLKSQILEQAKIEIKQRKIPTPYGGGNQMESIYSPMSTNEDFFFAMRNGQGSTVETLPGGCLDLSTKIPLLDGRTLTLEEMIEEHQEGKQNWIYSVDTQTGEMIPGIVSWAGITHEKAEVYEIELDNGEKLIATGDHKFPVWGKGAVQLSDLTSNDSIIHFEKRTEKISSRTNDYEQVYDHKSKSWKFTHRITHNFMDNFDVPTYIHDEKYAGEFGVIHHIDGNRFNNNPDNLIWMNYNDHYKKHASEIIKYQPMAVKANQEKYHSDPIYQQEVKNRLKEIMKDYYDYLFNNENAYVQHCNNISDGLIQYIESMDDEEKEFRASTSRKNFYKGTLTFQEKINTDSDFKKEFYKKTSATMADRFHNDEKFRERLIAHCNNIRTSINNQKIIFTDDMLTIVRYLFDTGTSNQDDMISKLNRLPEFINLWRITNTPQIGKITNIKSDFKQHHLDMLLKHYGYAGWKGLTEERLRLSKIDESAFQKMTKEMTEKEISILQFLIQLAKQYKNAYKICNVANEDDDLRNNIIEKFNSLFINTKRGQRGIRNENTIQSFALNKMAKYFGYNSFRHLTEDGSLFNHRIVSVTKLEGYRPVGTITVDQKELYNQSHTFALSCGILSFNSNLGQLEDLDYWYQKMWRALRIPQSYMSNSVEGGSPFNDGKVGIAYQQEIQFALYIMSLQIHFEDILDREFKKFLLDQKINVDFTIFKIELPEPSNFKKYKEQELNQQSLNLLSTALGIEGMSKRFAYIKYGQLSKEEVILNERLKAEELGLDPNGGTKNMAKIYSPNNADSGGYDGGLTGGSGSAPTDFGGTSDTSDDDMDNTEGEPTSTGSSGSGEPESQNSTQNNS